MQVCLWITDKIFFYTDSPQSEKLIFSDNSFSVNAIEEFIIKNGKNLELEDYLSNTNVNYENRLSKFSLQLSNGIANTIKKGVDGFFNKMNK